MQNMFSLESLIEEVNKPSIASDYGNDHGMYGMEAFNALGEAEKISTEMNGFREGVRFADATIRKFAEEKGMESVGIYSMEGIKDRLKEAGGKAKEAMVNIWKKIVEAISNFIKQLQVWLSGPKLKSQAHFYKKKGNLISKNWEEGSKKKLKLFPKSDGGAEAFKSMEEKAKILKDIENLIKGSGGGLDKVKELSNITPKDFVNEKFFGTKDPKKEERSIGEVFDQNSFAELAKTDSIKRSLKFAQYQIKVAQSALKKAQFIVKKEGGNEEETKSLNLARAGVSKMTSLNLTTFSAYMKYRSDLASAMSKVVKGGKGTSSDDSSDDEGTSSDDSSDDDS